MSSRAAADSSTAVGGAALRCNAVSLLGTLPRRLPPRLPEITDRDYHPRPRCAPLSNRESFHQAAVACSRGVVETWSSTNKKYGHRHAEELLHTLRQERLQWKPSIISLIMPGCAVTRFTGAVFYCYSQSRKKHRDLPAPFCTIGSLLVSDAAQGKMKVNYDSCWSKDWWAMLTRVPAVLNTTFLPSPLVVVTWAIYFLASSGKRVLGPF